MSDLERRLADLADELDVPSGEDLPATVTMRLASSRAAPAPGWRRWRRWRRWVVGVVIVGTGVGAAPAVAEWLGLGGVVVHDDDPPPGVSSARERGRRVDLADVAPLVGFEPLLPGLLGEPDDVWVDEAAGADLVWLHWDDGPLITQLTGALDGRPVIQKYAPDAVVEEIRIDGRRAIWVGGPHHIVLGTEGTRGPTSARAAEGTLLIEIGSITVRIESQAGREEAIRVARSLTGT